MDLFNGIFFSVLPLEYGEMDTAAAMDTTETAKVKYSRAAIHCVSHGLDSLLPGHRHHVVNCGIATIGRKGTLKI